MPLPNLQNMIFMTKIFYLVINLQNPERKVTFHIGKNSEKVKFLILPIKVSLIFMNTFQVNSFSIFYGNNYNFQNIVLYLCLCFCIANSMNCILLVAMLHDSHNLEYYIVLLIYNK